MTNQEFINVVEAAEERFISYGLLHLNCEDEKVKSDTVEELIMNIIDLNREHDTLYADGITKGQVQCVMLRHRSIEDIYRTAKYYDENVILIDVIRALWKLNSEGALRYMPCSTINKFTYYNDSRYGCQLNHYLKEYPLCDPIVHNNDFKFKDQSIDIDIYDYVTNLKD